MFVAFAFAKTTALHGQGHEMQSNTTTLITRNCLASLARTPPELPCKYFYDERGSRLFEQICDQPEYYLTRTELAIMRDHSRDMATWLGDHAAVIELGSGFGRKTPLLLAALQHPACYVPVDIAPDALAASTRALTSRFNNLAIHPLCADYTADPLALPDAALAATRRAIYFPGSTIGNFHPSDAATFMRRLARLAGPDGRMIVGVDQRKDRATLERAYNDAAGVTAAFNLNLLHRLNRDAAARFDPAAFSHRAVFNDDASRMEMHLVATRDTAAHMGDATFTFAAGEHILTECSYKHTDDTFAALADGWSIQHRWADPRGWFAVYGLSATHDDQPIQPRTGAP